MMYRNPLLSQACASSLVYPYAPTLGYSPVATNSWAPLATAWNSPTLPLSQGAYFTGIAQPYGPFSPIGTFAQTVIDPRTGIPTQFPGFTPTTSVVPTLTDSLYPYAQAITPFAPLQQIPTTAIPLSSFPISPLPTSTVQSPIGTPSFINPLLSQTVPGTWQNPTLSNQLGLSPITAQTGFTTSPLVDSTNPLFVNRFARPYFGMTPKGYNRNDSRIQEEICDRIMVAGDFDPTDVEIRVQNGEVSLEGTCETRTARIAFENLCYLVPGVRSVRNLLRARVVGFDEFGMPGTPHLHAVSGTEAATKTRTRA